MIRLPYHFSSMSAQRFTWKIGGEAGVGIVTSGVLFAKMCAAMGRFTADYNDKPHIAAGELARTDVLPCPVPLMKLTQEAKGDEIMRNTVGIGASLAFMGCAFEPLEDALKKTFWR